MRDEKTEQNIIDSFDVESAVIGGLLLGGHEALRRLPGQLDHSNFVFPLYRDAYSVALDLYGDEQPIDVITVAERLERRYENALSQLSQCVQNTASFANIRRYAELVIEKSARRAALKKVETIAHGLSSRPVFELAGEIHDLSLALKKSGLSPLLPPRLDIEALVNGDDIHLDYVLPSLVVGTVGCFAGRGGVGKGMLSLEILCDMVTGAGITGLVNHPCDGKVAFVSIEDDQITLSRRLQVIARRFPEETRQQIFDQVDVVSIYGQAHSVLLSPGPQGMKRNERMIEELKQRFGDYRLLIFDTLRKFTGIDENRSDEASAAVQIFDEIAHATGAAVIFVHHLAKEKIKLTDDISADDIRGSSALVNDARWAAILTGLSKSEREEYGVSDESKGDFRKIEIVKANHGQSASTWYLQHVEFGFYSVAEAFYRHARWQNRASKSKGNAK